MTNTEKREFAKCNLIESLRTTELINLNLFKGFFRLSLLISLLVFLWVSIMVAPQRTNIAFGISDQDALDLRKSASVFIEGYKTSYEEGHKYENGIIVENKYIKKNLDDYISDEDKNEALENCFAYWVGYGSYYKQGVICSVSYHPDPIVKKSLDRIVATEWYSNYSTGFLVDNEKYGIKKSDLLLAKDGDNNVYAHYLPNGYSIILGAKEQFIECSRMGGYVALFAFFCTSLVLPLLCYILCGLLMIPGQVVQILLSYFNWVRKGFQREKCKKKDNIPNPPSDIA